jgi:galacturan 1,4-alpha-galacturonidase
MRFQLSTILVIASASVSTAIPTWQSFTQWRQGPQGKSAPDHTSTRPTISYSPKLPHVPPPCPQPRFKTCFVQSHNDGVTDDSPYILKALHECNYGGHVVFREGIEYLIGTALDLTFLNSIDLGTPSHQVLGLQS